uniref:Ig-like domain-containing protein n=1 Tax=Xiphophorus maculatus TaxID=8083 RepID=A0A3B5QZP8_XIPMA
MTALWPNQICINKYTPTANMLVPVKTVALGQPATFTCPFPADMLSNNEVHWYKQSTGDTLTLIVRLRKHADPAFGQKFSFSRMTASKNETVSRLTILRTVPEDEGMYHCAIIDWTENAWHGTYLYLKGNRTPMHTIVQQLTAADSHLPGDSVTLQCSVLSNPDKMCPEDLSVFWFRARSHNSHPHTIYVDGNKHDDCNKRNDSQRRCAFSKTISSTDSDTYYCAVATCGEIFIGKETKAKVQVVLPFCVVLALSLISTVVVLFSISTSKYMDNKGNTSQPLISV